LTHTAKERLPIIRRCRDSEFEKLWAIINEGALAYKGIIPDDRWAEPYMSREKLWHEINQGVVFWGCEEADDLAAVMGLQDVGDVTLVRHAYVRTGSQRRGLGAQLLNSLREMASRPVLVGTWADAAWAIRFYEKHGFKVVSPVEKDRLLRKYWSIPDRQIETSVVLADATWRELHDKAFSAP
jgi:GNAT superfamily N-acetyltransferase